MPDSFFRVPPDSTGAKIRTRTRTIGADTVHQQAVFEDALPSYFILADSVVPAQNKHHLTIWNGHASAVLRLKKLFAISLQSAAVTGGLTRVDVKRIDTLAPTLGTLLTEAAAAAGNIVRADTGDGALPAGIECRVGSTVVGANEKGIIFPVLLTTEENLSTVPLDKSTFLQSVNLVPESGELKEPTLRPGEGISIKQITNIAAGALTWLACLTLEV